MLLEKILQYSFTALFSISSLLFILNIDSFSGLISSDSVFIAERCEDTIPPSTKCSQNLDCADRHLKQMALTKRGEGLCCCIPIRIAQYNAGSK